MSYTRESVERLMPAVWDTFRVLNGPREIERDPELQGRKGTSDPRRSSDTLTMCADVQRAWKLADLTQRQRQVLLLRFGFGEPLLDEVGEVLGISKQAAAKHLDVGLDRIVNFLNGTEEVAA